MLPALVLAAAWVTLAAVGLRLSVIDAREHRLPNALVLPLYPLGLIALAAHAALRADLTVFLHGVAAAVLMFSVYVVLYATGDGIGAGDVKLAGALGLFLGPLGWDAVALGLAGGFVLGGVYALHEVATGSAHRGTRIAFGPFLLAGAGLAAAAWAGPWHPWVKIG